MPMPTSRDCSAPCKPRFATPATGRPNLAAGIGKTAELLGFRTPLGPGLMPWQHEVNAVATELTAGGPVRVPAGRARGDAAAGQDG